MVGKRLLYKTTERARGRLLEAEQSKLLLRRVESLRETMIVRRQGRRVASIHSFKELRIVGTLK